MLTEERYSRILAIVDSEGSATVADLVRRLDISESTVRRDLAAMAEKGLLVKVYGGAISASHTKIKAREESVPRRTTRFAAEKDRIARYAASLIRPDDFVFLDAGTTTERMLDYVTPGPTFVTHAVSHALRLSSLEIRVILLGGEMKATSEIVFGEGTIQALSRFRFTKGFFGTDGISLTDGYSTPDPREAAVKAVALSACRQGYLLADASKFNAESNVRFARFEDAIILTDRAPEGDFRGQENILIV